MGHTIPISQLADEVMKGLTEYADLATEDLKKDVKKAAQTAQKQIKETAPKKTGAYSKSWATKTTKETANSLEVTVYSKNKYQLAHLLEHGHAKRNGGRTRAFPHIAPAEEKAAEELERDITRDLQKGG